MKGESEGKSKQDEDKGSDDDASDSKEEEDEEEEPEEPKITKEDVGNIPDFTVACKVACMHILCM